MDKLQTFIILGASGHARETAIHLLDISASVNLVFVDDAPPSPSIVLRGKDYTVTSDWNSLARLPGAQFLVGVGVPRVKKILVAKALAAKLVPAPTQVHPSALVQDARLGVGGLVAPGVVVTTNVTVGDYVVLNTNVTVGHDAMIGDFVTCNPGSNISGHTHLGPGVYFGVGAATKEGVKIASNCVIGGKAFVHKDALTDGQTLVGVPARPIPKV